MDEQPFTLADAITGLRAELREAAKRAGADPWFKYDKVEVRVVATELRKKQGGLKLAVFEAGGNLGGEKSHTEGVEIKLTLEVVDPRSLVPGLRDRGYATAGSDRDEPEPTARSRSASSRRNKVRGKR